MRHPLEVIVDLHLFQVLPTLTWFADSRAPESCQTTWGLFLLPIGIRAINSNLPAHALGLLSEGCKHDLVIFRTIDLD